MVDELSYISRLRHPNLVLFLGAVTTSSPQMILTEFLSQGSLEDHVARQKVHNRNAGAKHPWLPTARIVHRWCVDLAKALSFLHSCVPPVTHRDLHPSKCLLQDDLHLKVSDFGMSKTLQLDDVEGKPIIRSSALHCWQAPELLRGDGIFDHTVDLYSMGMIYWFIVHGEKPFSKLPQNTVSHAVCELRQRPSLEGIEDRYGAETVLVMGRLWEHQPELRMRAEEVVDEMEACQRRLAPARCDSHGSGPTISGGRTPTSPESGSHTKQCAVQ
uniref:Protein kinase domain-containing protein n=1 Tax=Hemiselmis tepida TaxID=464990 RepID=A0A7S0VXF4_9CRYP